MKVTMDNYAVPIKHVKDWAKFDGKYQNVTESQTLSILSNQGWMDRMGLVPFPTSNVTLWLIVLVVEEATKMPEDTKLAMSCTLGIDLSVIPELGHLGPSEIKELPVAQVLDTYFDNA